MSKWMCCSCAGSDGGTSAPVTNFSSALSRWLEKLARRYGGREPFDDLLQVARLALLKAIDRFDPDRGTAFSSLAVPTILGEAKRYFRDVGWFAHVPRGVQELALKVKEAERRLSSTSGRSPTAQDLAAYLELPVEDVLEGLCAAEAHHATSIDVPLDDGGDEGAALVDTFGAEDGGGPARRRGREHRRQPSRAIKARAPRAEHVLLEELTQAQIGQRIDVCKCRCRGSSVGRQTDCGS